MADITIKILEPADNFALTTLDELKIALGMASSDTSSDALLQQLVDQYSDVVSTMCNRVFAKEKVRETWRDLGDRRLYLSHWPVLETDIESVEAPKGTVIDSSVYELEEGSGKLSLFESRAEPIVVTYTGGFVLPDDAPDALKHACQILVRGGRGQAQREAVAGMRSIMHKQSRIMFFDPNVGGGGGSTSSSSMSSTIDAAKSLLYHYMRIWV